MPLTSVRAGMRKAASLQPSRTLTVLMARPLTDSVIVCGGAAGYTNGWTRAESERSRAAGRFMKTVDAVPVAHDAVSPSRRSLVEKFSVRIGSDRSGEKSSTIGNVG